MDLDWVKSSFCDSSACVEIAAPDLAWIKSHQCDTGTCVEIAEQNDTRYMRDAQGTTMALDLDALRGFLSDVRAGALDQYV